MKGYTTAGVTFIGYPFLLYKSVAKHSHMGSLLPDGTMF